jgi:hypothetical protein
MVLHRASLTPARQFRRVIALTCDTCQCTCPVLIILAFLHAGFPACCFTLNFCSATRSTDLLCVAKAHLMRSRWPGFVFVMCVRTDRLRSCTSSKTSLYCFFISPLRFFFAYFCSLIQRSGIISYLVVNEQTSQHARRRGIYTEPEPRSVEQKPACLGCSRNVCR